LCGWQNKENGNQGRGVLVLEGLHILFLGQGNYIISGYCNYDNIRTINGVIYKTYKEVCYAMGLLAEDKEFIDAIIEASNLASGALEKIVCYTATHEYYV